MKNEPNFAELVWFNSFNVHATAQAPVFLKITSTYLFNPKSLHAKCLKMHFVGWQNSVYDGP